LNHFTVPCSLITLSFLPLIERDSIVSSSCSCNHSASGCQKQKRLPPPSGVAAASCHDWYKNLIRPRVRIQQYTPEYKNLGACRACPRIRGSRVPGAWWLRAISSLLAVDDVPRHRLASPMRATPSDSRTGSQARKSPGTC
jgi:hypothetical protein